MMKTYQFIGTGRGVPELPHTLTDADAKRLGVEKVLQDAIEAGNYEEVSKTAAVLPAVENKTEKSVEKIGKKQGGL